MFTVTVSCQLSSRLKTSKCRVMARLSSRNVFLSTRQKCLSITTQRHLLLAKRASMVLWVTEALQARLTCLTVFQCD